VRVLLTGPSPTVGEPVQDILRGADPGFEVIRDPLSPGVLEQIANGIFDGVVCRADGPEAIHFLSRIRGQNTEVPIVVLSAKADAGFGTQALSIGASSVLPAEAEAAVIAENVRQLMNLREAGRMFQEKSRDNERLRTELRQAVLHRKSISECGDHINRHWRRRGLLPLVVQNDPEAAFLMVKALEKADVFAPLPIMSSVDEALRYLQGSPPYSDRQIHPLPNAILLDLNPTVLGGKLLQWIRSQSSISGIPVIVLSNTGQPEELQAAYGNLANSFLVKPAVFDELVMMVRSIDVYWTRINIGRTP
jgi:DNA-binding response OmpR family regulator